MSGASLGVVLFDDPSLHASGWALRAGERPSRITSTADLSAHTVWWTNLDYPDYMRSGLSRSPRFRGARFFRTSAKALLKEVDLASAPVRERLEYLLHLFTATLQCAYDLGLTVVPPDTLARGFREVTLGRSHGTQGSADVREAIETATQPYTFCEAPPWRTGDRVLTLVRQRAPHCSDLLAAPVPKGMFRPVPLAELPSDTTGLAEYERPLLLRVRIDRFSKELSSLINHGAGALPLIRPGASGQYSEANGRQWLSQPEFQLLAANSDMQVEQALVAEGFRDNPFVPPELPARRRLSPAFGLACESLWSAGVRTLSGRIDHSPMSVWLQARDRVICLSGALTVLRRYPDAIVQHYGSGRITLRVQDDGRYLGERLCYALSDTDWLAPLISEQTHPGFPLPERPQTADILRVLAMRGRLDSILAMDHSLLASEQAAGVG